MQHEVVIQAHLNQPILHFINTHAHILNYLLIEFSHKMVREADHSSGVALSSIALLQERFRQLQKMKELRQEKELLRMLSESERYSPPIIPYNYDQFRSNTFSGSESVLTFLPPKTHCQLSLSLWPDSQTTKHPDSWGIVEAQSNRAKSSLVCTSSIKLENSGSDIDTSLHL